MVSVAARALVKPRASCMCRCYVSFLLDRSCLIVSTAGFRVFDGRLQSCNFKASCRVKIQRVSAAVIRTYTPLVAYVNAGRVTNLGKRMYKHAQHFLECVRTSCRNRAQSTVDVQS